MQPAKFDLGPLDYVPWLLVPLALIVAVGLLVLWRVIVVARGSAGKSGGIKLPTTGVEICEGRPGAGKSFFGVSELLRSVIDERRPVYTNLPLKWRVFRAYVRLRGGAELARLVYSIDKEHFERFLKRTAARAALSELWKNRKAGDERAADEFERRGEHSAAMALRRGIITQYSAAAFEAAVVAECGPAIHSGPGANAIHAMAFIVLDELHRWYSMQDQRRFEVEWADLRGYLTMHRHQLHRLLIITQERMQVAKVFRDQAQYFWVVRNRGDDKLAWGVRMKHLGLNALAYAQYTPEQEAARSLEEQAPSKQFTVFHWAWWEVWKFRCYESFTHAGGRRGLLKSCAAARLDAGLTSSGMLAAEERHRDQRARQLKAERSGVFRMRKWSRRGLFAAGVVTSFYVGRTVGLSGSSAGSPSSLAAAVIGSKPSPTPRKDWGKFSGIGRDYARFNGDKVAKGGRLGNGVVLREVDLKLRSVLLDDAGELWVWKYGGEVPTRVGTQAKIRDAVGARLARARNGGADDDPQSSSVGPLEPSPGVGVR